MKKLSKSQAEVWDRLKNGIPRSYQDEFESVEAIILKSMAKQLAAKIDEELLKTLLATYTDD